MNCTNCNTPGAPHELIGGLCHRCTAKELEVSRSETIHSAVSHSNDVGWWMAETEKLRIEERDQLKAQLEAARKAGEDIVEGMRRAHREEEERLRGERDKLQKQLEAAQAAGTGMRNAILSKLSPGRPLLAYLHEQFPSTIGNIPLSHHCMRLHESALSSDCDKAYRERMERYEKALRVVADRLEIVAHIGTENDFEELKEIADQALRETTP